MAKISSKPIEIPSGLNVSLVEGELVAKSAQNQELRVKVLEGIEVEVVDGKVLVKEKNTERQTKAFGGLIRSLIRNAFEGLTKGFTKELKLVGTGYRVQMQGTDLNLAVGYSHPVIYKTPKDIKVTVQGTNAITVSGFDRQAVGQVAANIRAVRPPEPYKGKGIRYADEVVRRKAGKAAAK